MTSSGLLSSFWILMAAMSASQAQPLVTVSNTVSKPGEQMKVSVILGNRGAELRSLKVKFTFPRGLEYVKASLGINAELGKVQMKAPGTNSTPEIELSSPDGPMPEGLLISLDVNIAKDAKVGETLKVVSVATATSKAGDRLKVESEGGDVVIVAELPVSSCFFYMH